MIRGGKALPLTAEPPLAVYSWKLVRRLLLTLSRPVTICTGIVPRHDLTNLMGLFIGNLLVVCLVLCSMNGANVLV